MAKVRLDQLMVERGIAESREQAQRLIRAGAVTAAGQTADKPGRVYPLDVRLDVSARERFVSRGGLKLDHAMEIFGLQVKGLVCLDVGASTGGFTDCLLQRGAARVYAVDVGRGQLHWRLRNDPRVVVREGVNARYLAKCDFPEEMDFAVADVSFISLTRILAPIKDLLKAGAAIVTLIKPQFEAGRGQVDRGGVVRDPETRQGAIEKVRRFGVEMLDLEWHGLCESPIKGPAGNIEFLAYWKKK